MNEKYPLALPEGTVLAGQYIVEKVLGEGGFGITYEARDYKTNERVAVKEFFPDAMATRTNQTTVSPFSGEKGESYAYGKTCFLQEAETLAKFIGNENIVRIHSYFEENGTAYFVMDFIEGTSFDEYLKERGGKIPYEEAAGILIPVMDALSAVHSKGIVHRDVTPDNIYITKEGVVKLLDFGAARYSLGDQSRSLDIILKHGFAPKEQYTRRGKQGPYTDVYALGATFYFALTGKRPPDSVERLDEDDLVPPSSLGVQIGGAAEDAILTALSVQSADRFQNMTAFKNALLNSRQPSMAAAGSQPAVSQTYFTAPDQGSVPRSGPAAPAPGGQDSDLQNLADTMKTAGRLAGRLAGRMAGKVAEKTAETAGVMAGTAGKMSEIMAAKKAETAQKLAEKAAQREAEKAAREEAARQAAAAQAARQEQASEDGSPPPDGAVGRTLGGAPAPVPAKPGPSKKLLLIGAAVAAALLIVLFMVTRGKPDKRDVAEKDTNPPAQASAAAQTSPPAQTATPAAPTPTPEPPAPTQAAYTLSGNWKVVGNHAENIMNGGICTNGYFIEDAGHSLRVSSKQDYIFEDEEGTFSDLSFTDGMLFFLFEGFAFALDPETEEPYDISELNDYFGESIQRLLLTEDFYVVCCRNGDSSSTVYRVLRANGEIEECCTIRDVSCFTLSDDGWLYYALRGDDGVSGVYRMRLDTLEENENLVVHNNIDYTFCNLIVADSSLYLLVYNEATLEDYGIARISREEGYADDSPIWEISQELGAPIREGGAGFNVNWNNDIIYFYAYMPDGGNGDIPNLYEIKGHEDGAFEMKQISQNSYNPTILYNNDDNDGYQLNYFHLGEDNDSYKVYYRNYDKDGNQIKNN